MAFLSFSTFLEDEPCRARVRLGAGRFLSVVHFLSMLALGVFVLQDLLGPSLCWEVAWFADLLLSSCGHCPGIRVPYLAEAHVSSRSRTLEDVVGLIRSLRHLLLLGDAHSLVRGTKANHRTARGARQRKAVYLLLPTLRHLHGQALLLLSAVYFFQSSLSLQVLAEGHDTASGGETEHEHSSHARWAQGLGATASFCRADVDGTRDALHYRDVCGSSRSLGTFPCGKEVCLYQDIDWDHAASASAHECPRDHWGFP